MSIVPIPGGAFPIKYTGDQPIQCMTDGEIVAYRINQDYIPIQWGGMTLQLLGSFVLVHHEVQLGETQSSGLHFYTLYMHLAPHLAYQKSGVVLNGNITQGIALCNTQWASLPNSPHNQPTEKPNNALAYYDTFLEQEKNNISSLVATAEEMTKLIKLTYPTVNL
ncbi:hypothetical protein ACRBF7_001302 [Providencia stuartii]|uniref:hypothetical protein n=1 Tax=Providencia stuartii TaxID=588 RepID=UPI000C9C39A1|nr:Phage-related lysozyme (muraminidase) [Providencia stuartii]HEM8214740.1 hypothetical protein [Providencia stuartii]